MGLMTVSDRNISIDGVAVEPLKQFVDERGKVMHMLRVDSPLYKRFGEIYFSTIKHGATKAWKKHYSMTQLFSVPIGKIRLVIYDDREGSKTLGNLKVMELGEDFYVLVKIPPLLWYGFQGISDCDALVANCADIPHDSSEQMTANLFDDRFPYRW